MDIRLPRLGEGADSGSVVNVFVKEGDRIKKDQTLIELENEKAVAAIPSTSDGTVSKVHVKPGDKLSVGQLIVTLAEGNGGVAPAAAATEPRVAAPRSAAKPSLPAGRSGGQAGAASSEPAQTAGTKEPSPGGPPPAASPAIRKLARELGIDLRRVTGSERGGRIVLDDLRVYIQRLQQRAAQPTSPVIGHPSPVSAEPIDFSKWGPVTKTPMSSLRQTVARRMASSWTTIPHVTQFDDADLTVVLDLKKKHEAAYDKQGVRLTVTAFILKAVARTLQAHPKFNASLDEAAQQIVQKQYYHLGIAVDTDAGLIVPVLKDVDKKPLLQLSKELNELAERARNRKVTAEELQGSTFSISNQGGIGGAYFTPIIKKPDAAILGLGKAVLKPVVREGKVEPRMMLPLGLSYDHRIIDGADAARFITDLVKAIEQFTEGDVKL